MIVARQRPDTSAIAGHYDDLDRFYREVWGEHVHHGVWESPSDPPEVATRRLIDLVAARAGVAPGASVCDVGCGYGGTARVLAREYGARVVGYTVSRAQYDHACAASARAGDPEFHLSDWLANDLASASCDAVISIESSEHFEDKPRFFEEAARVLRPGGRVVVCAWLAGDRPRRWEEALLLEPICSEGRMPSMGDEGDYRGLFRRAGLVVDGFEDLSHKVRATWSVCLRRLGRGLVHDPSYRAALRDRGLKDRGFLVTMARIWLAYTTGAMRYGLFAARKAAA